jgi:hypothetical protein
VIASCSRVNSRASGHTSRPVSQGIYIFVHTCAPFFLVVAFRDTRFLSGLYGRFSYIVVERNMEGQPPNWQTVRFMKWNDENGRWGSWVAPSGEKPSSFVLAFKKARAPPISMRSGGTTFTVRGYRDYPGGPRPTAQGSDGVGGHLTILLRTPLVRGRACCVTREASVSVSFLGLYNTRDESTSVGLSVCRSVGLSVCRSVGLSVCRSCGRLGSRSLVPPYLVPSRMSMSVSHD